MRRLAVPLLALSLLTTSAAGCGDDDGSAADDGRLRIATTVAPITSIVANIAGDRAEITGIVPEGTNSHTFEPRPSVAELLSDVDVVYLNGLQLEEPTKELAEANLRDDAEIVELGAQAIDESEWIYDVSFPKADGKPNPHLWTDPQLALRYAMVVRDDLVQRDAANAPYYRHNYELFAEKVGELDDAMRTAFSSVEKPELLTYHDAYAYFARSYGWTVIGAIQVSDFEDPTPSEVADLIEQVRDLQVPAIFGSEVFPSPVLEQIARETDAEYVDDLRDDDLPGEPGEPDHSWLGLMVFDYATITRALGGDPRAIEEVAVRDVASDESHYPQ